MRPLLALLAVALAAGCTAPTTAVPARVADAGAAQPDAATPADDAAIPGGEDARVLDAAELADAGHAPDASAPGDAGDGPLPTTGCFADETTLEVVVVPQGRAHPQPRALIARDDGWIAIYRGAAQDRAVFLDIDGTVRASQDYSGVASARVIDLGTSLLMVTDYDQTRVDLDGDGFSPQFYAPVGIDTIRTIAAQGPRTIRAISSPYVDNVPRFRVTDLTLADGERTGFVVREELLPDVPELGVSTHFTPFIVGERVHLLGTGSFGSSAWRALVVELAQVGSPSPLAWRLVDDAPWPIEPPERVIGLTSDGRRALIPRVEGMPAMYASYLEPLPHAGPAAGEALRMEGRPRQLLESEGHVSVLFDERLAVFAAADLTPLAELRVDGGWDLIAAQRGNRAAVLYQVGGGGPEARIGLRCVAIPAAP